MTDRSNYKNDSAPANGYQRRRQETRRQLMDAARTLFIERGVDQVSIDAITSTAGVAKGSFYNHFESRDDLFHVLIGEVLHELLAEGLSQEPDYGDQLENGLARTWYIHYRLLSDPDACKLLLQSGSAAASGGAIDRVFRTALSDRLRGGAELGSLKHIDWEILHAAYYGAVTNTIGHFLAQGEELDAESAADQLTEICFAILGLPHHKPRHFLADS